MSTLSTPLVATSLLTAATALAGGAALMGTYLFYPVTALAGGTALMGTYIIYPGAILDGYVYVLKSRCGLKSRFVDIKAPDSDVIRDDPEFRWHYLDSDPENSRKLPVLLLIHGFSSASDSWCRLAAHATKDFRVIVPDLTGHGETTPLDRSASYDIPVQTERLLHFINTVIGESEPFHVTGTSMGGWLTAELAIHLSTASSETSDDGATSSHRLRSAVMMCPAGINPEEATEEQRKDFHSTVVQLLPKTVDELMDMFKMVSLKARMLPRRVLTAYMERRSRHYDIYSSLMKDMTSENQSRLLTPDRLGSISCPSLVLWGEDDRLLAPLGIDIFKRDIQGAEARLIPQCGHAMLIDQLGLVQRHVLEFARRHI